ncbi:MAG: cyclase family protein, partial [Granulosicoccus sp.]|nr:cyclase family protein [Granulosicoccus sp.]
MFKFPGLVTASSVALLAVSGMAKADPASDIAAAVAGGEVVDLTVTISENYPAHWPFHPPFRRWTMNWFETKDGPYTANPREGAGGEGDTVKENLVQSVFPYYSQQMVIDEHTGTQADFPAHFVPPEGSGIEFQSEAGWMTGDKYPVENMMGPAVVVDVSAILDKADGGMSPLITVDMIKADEEQNGEIKAGEVVLFYSGYDDLYYKPFPEGNRLAWDPLVGGNVPGWPAPTPEAVEYLASKGVTHLATDGPSMGPIGHMWEGKPMA